jgi:phosphatidyl-myo-inositol alpha-mannosyltransferase
MSRRVVRVMMTADAIGGVWNYALDLARGFARHDIETVLAILGPSPDCAQRAQAEAIGGLRLMDAGLPLEWTARDAAALRATGVFLDGLAEELRPEIIHLNTPALAADMHHAAPVIAMAHSCLGTWWRAVRREPLPADFAWRVAATRRGLAAADSVIAASHSFAEALSHAYGNDLPVEVVLNGRAATALEIDKRPLIFTAGRLWDEGKNIAVLDRAAVKMEPPVVAAGPLTGPNGARGEFAHLKLVGTLNESEIVPWYAAASIFASPARYEPFGLAVLQAAQAGTALVLSDIPTFRELWDGVALFCPVDDDIAWRHALEDLLGAPQRARALGRAAQHRAARYSLEAMVCGTLDVYSRALARKTSFAPSLHAVP